MAKENRRGRPFGMKVVVGFGLLSIATILTGITILGYYAYDRQMSSLLFIQNRSGENVRFERIMLDDQVLWQGPDTIVKAITDLDKPSVDSGGGGPMPYFRAPKKYVELKIVAVNGLNKREVVSCTLDNRSRPCLFEVHYYEGRLVCHDCDKWFLD
jgi:hypothetical protein